MLALMCAKDIELCYDHNCMHKIVLQELYYLEIWMCQTNEKASGRYKIPILYFDLNLD